MQVFATFLILLLSIAQVVAAPARTGGSSGAARPAKTGQPASQNKATKAPGVAAKDAGSVSGRVKGAEDVLWGEARTAAESGNASEAARLLRLCLRARVNVQEAETLLRGYIGSETAAIIGSRSFEKLSEPELQQVLLLQKELCDFKSATSSDWRRLLEISRVFKGDQQFVVAGEALLNKIKAGLPVNVDAEWIKYFKDLEKQMGKNTQVLYRLQLNEILAGIEATAAEYRPKLENLRILAQANAIKILGQADVAMALGDLDQARRYIQQVREFDPQYPGLDRSAQKLVKATELQRLIGLASVAMRDRLFLEAKRLCGEIQKMDANNAYARSTIQQIDEISSRGGAARIESAEAKVTLAIRRLETDLRKAEQEQDALLIRASLKELLLLKSDNLAWLERLAEIENQIAVSGLNAEDSFKQAQTLFKDGRFAELRLFLNRNPGLMNSVDTMVQVWEMRLMANFHTGHLNAAELKEAAEAIIGRAGESFYASFVLMKLALADNRIVEARAHYQAAVKINPAYQGLRWPGWLLWAHGEGRPAVVVALIVIFFLLIQLLRPAIAMYESTYWLRVGLMARVFPSLALRSLEGCFGIYRDSGDRIKLFRLLVRCSVASGNAKKAALYAANLSELVPNDPLARAAGVVSPTKGDAHGQQSTSVETHSLSEAQGKLLNKQVPEGMPPVAANDGSFAHSRPAPALSPISMPKKPGAAKKVTAPEPEQYSEPLTEDYSEPGSEQQYAESEEYANPQSEQYIDSQQGQYSEPSPEGYAQPEQYPETSQEQYSQPDQYTDVQSEQYPDPGQYSQSQPEQYSEPGQYAGQQPDQDYGQEPLQGDFPAGSDDAFQDAFQSPSQNHSGELLYSPDDVPAYEQGDGAPPEQDQGYDSESGQQPLAQSYDAYSAEPGQEHAGEEAQNYAQEHLRHPDDPYGEQPFDELNQEPLPQPASGLELPLEYAGESEKIENSEQPEQAEYAGQSEHSEYTAYPEQIESLTARESIESYEVAEQSTVPIFTESIEPAASSESAKSLMSGENLDYPAEAGFDAAAYTEADSSIEDASNDLFKDLFGNPVAKSSPETAPGHSEPVYEEPAIQELKSETPDLPAVKLDYDEYEYSGAADKADNTENTDSTDNTNNTDTDTDNTDNTYNPDNKDSSNMADGMPAEQTPAAAKLDYDDYAYSGASTWGDEASEIGEQQSANGLPESEIPDLQVPSQPAAAKLDYDDYAYSESEVSSGSHADDADNGAELDAEPDAEEHSDFDNADTEGDDDKDDDDDDDDVEDEDEDDDYDDESDRMSRMHSRPRTGRGQANDNESDNNTDHTDHEDDYDSDYDSDDDIDDDDLDDVHDDSFLTVASDDFASGSDDRIDDESIGESGYGAGNRSDNVPANAANNEYTLQPETDDLASVMDQLALQQQNEQKVFDLDSPDSQASSAADTFDNSENAPVYNIEEAIRETRSALFAELDTISPAKEPGKAWRDALRTPADPASLFPDL